MKKRLLRFCVCPREVHIKGIKLHKIFYKKWGFDHKNKKVTFKFCKLTFNFQKLTNVHNVDNYVENLFLSSKLSTFVFIKNYS